MKKLLAFLLLVAMLVSLSACGKPKKSSHRHDDDDDDDDEISYYDESDSAVGEGTQESPLIISTADELFQFAEDYNAYKLPSEVHVKLGADIVVNDIADVYMELTADDLDGYRMWIPVQTFYGTFDGDGHTVSGIVCCMETEQENHITHPSAFFGFVYGTVKNLTVKDSFFTSNTDNYTAGICGGLRGTLENCHNYARVQGCSSSGGVASSNLGGLIKDCTNHADISNIADGNSKGLGGICGSHGSDYEKETPARIVGCVNYGAINGVHVTGGIAGYSRGFVENCVNKGDITSDYRAGGIVGDSDSNGKNVIGNIVGCINYGNVEADRDAGGIAGASSVAPELGHQYGILNSVNYGDIKSNYEAGGIATYIGGGIASGVANFGNVTVYTEEFHGGVAGGICAWDREESVFVNCFNAGDVTTSKEASGLCNSIRGQWMNCYSGGMITSQTKGAFGIAANVYVDTAKITNCFFIGEVTGDDSSNPMIKDLYDMDYGDRGFVCGTNAWNRDLALDASWYLGFDFESVWVMGDSAGYLYPTLRNLPKDFTK